MKVERKVVDVVDEDGVVDAHLSFLWLPYDVSGQ